MKGKLVSEAQPFGQVHSSMAHASTMATPTGMKNACGSDRVVGNNGKTTVESFADKNPGAYEAACKNRDNPFAFVGKPEGSSKVDLTSKDYRYGN